MTAPLSAANAKRSASPAGGRGFMYGAHFYHPRSGPRPDQFREMIRAIANTHRFNTVQIWSNWDYYNPKPGEYQFEDLEQLLSTCDEFDVGVLMNVMLESSPYWLEQAHPEARHVNAAGRAVHLGGSGAHYTGGSPGLCFDHKAVRDAAADYVRELVKMAAPHRSLHAYDVWNEPAFVDIYGKELSANLDLPEYLFCYCEQTILEFQNWLRKRYQSIENLNESWLRRYPDWTAIDPPRQPQETFQDWMDWRQFIQDRTTEYLRFRVETIAEVDSKHTIEAHVAYTLPRGPVTVRGVQPWRLAELVQVFGCSFYPGGLLTPVDEAAGEFDFVRSCAAEKPFWITEMQGGPIAGYPMPPRAIRVWNWLAVAAGAKGISYWAYLAEGTHTEAPGFGLVARTGAPTERVEEAARANRLIQERWRLLEAYRPRPSIAILFDQDNSLLTFAKDANEETPKRSIAGYCKALWQLDFPIDFIEPNGLANSRHRILVVPHHIIGKRGTANGIRTFAERGGTVVLEAGFGRFDANYFANAVVPPFGLDEVFGYCEQESIAVSGGKFPLGSLNIPPADSNSYDAWIEFTQPLPMRAKADTYLVPLQIRGGESIATSKDWAVASVKSVGKGKVYFIGTNLGGSIAGGDPGGVQFLRNIVSAVVQPDATSAGALRPRLIEGPRGGLLVVFNDTETNQTSTVKISANFKLATDVYSGRRQEIKGGAFDVSVPFKDVGVFDLS